MAAALECWARRKSTNADEQVLMPANLRSDHSSSSTTTTFKDPSLMHKKLLTLTRNVSDAISSFKNSLTLDSPRDTNTNNFNSRRKPSSALRQHHLSFPNNYSQVGFEMKDVLLHMQLIDQALENSYPSVNLQDLCIKDGVWLGFKLTFACHASVSGSAVAACLESNVLLCKKVQIFERRGCSLGVVDFVVKSGDERMMQARVETVLKTCLKKNKPSNVKMHFGLCGCQQEGVSGREQGDTEEDVSDRMDGMRHEKVPLQLKIPLPGSCIEVMVDEWQTVCFGRAEIDKWLLSPDGLEFGDQIALNSFKGVFKGKRVAIEKVRGCDKGGSFEFVLRRDLLELMTCRHKSLAQFYGVCIDEYYGLCVLTQLMECGSLMDLISKKKKFQIRELTKIMIDVAEGLRFMNDHSVAYKDLNTQRIMMDRHGNACLGDMGIFSSCKGIEALEFETDGYRWLAPEIIAADPETVTETWMSNVYSFGMVMWEMVTGEAAYNAYSPVQAAVGIAACGLRPEIPKDCPPFLESLMKKCWNTSPTNRPQFAEIISVLCRPSSDIR